MSDISISVLTVDSLRLKYAAIEEAERALIYLLKPPMNTICGKYQESFTRVFGSVGNVSTETVRKYIEEQRNK